MLANYHTHTRRCMHAGGTDEEYIQKAIAENLKILGFSDHAPYIYGSGYVSFFRMAPDVAEEYHGTLSSLREKYADKIEIHIGYEAEFYPKLWDKTLDFWRKCPPEYLILGQHYVDFENINGVFGSHSHIESGSSDRERVKHYVDRVIAGMATERFSCVAHPDILTYTGPDLDYYLNQMQRLIDASRRYAVPLEYNLLGHSLKRKYPRREFWELVGENSGSALLGCDAHNPGRVADKTEIEEARALLGECGVKILDKIELRNPVF